MLLKSYVVLAFIASASVAWAKVESNTPPSQVERPSSKQPHFALPSARSCPDAKWGGFAIGEFLYWSAREDNLEIGQLSAAINTAALNSDKGHSIGLDFNYAPGLRLGGGVKMPWDRGNLTFLWTKFINHAKAKKELTLDNFNAVPSLVIHPLFRDVQDSISASGKWRIHFDDFDFDWSRATHFSKKIALTPRVGLRYSHIKQRIRRDYLQTNGTS